MSEEKFTYSVPVNEPIKSYAPGTSERTELKAAIAELRSQEIDIPMYIGGEEIRSNEMVRIAPPHDHKHTLGHFHKGSKNHVSAAIDAALKAKNDWENLTWEKRANTFLRAADLMEGPYRAKLNAATMLGQSKNSMQAEIDSACEMIDFLRFNVYYSCEIYKQQPVVSGEGLGISNKFDHRPLEGFIYALTPFNFTAIAGNLPTACAMLGNVVVWKPSNSQVYSANLLMKIFIEAGLPAGVINLIYSSGPDAAEVILSHRDFAGIHFTGSTAVFQSIWKTIGNNIHKYKTYPRIVGETGGKDFIVAHKSSEAKVVSTAISRGAFEYQGQKCSAASRVYVPDNIWEDTKAFLIEDLKSFKVGPIEDFSNFINAVISEKSFDKLSKFIDAAKKDHNVEIIAGGNYDKSKGYFIEPTVILTKDPNYVTMREELFGPVVTIYVYEADKFEETLKLVDETSTYALTGAIISQDRDAVDTAMKMLRNAAGNFYINDKPTGAVVGQQPFGGARASGTNDKAGSILNLIRWVSPRTVKETFDPPTDYRYPFLGED